jgi:hypothetical protein
VHGVQCVLDSAGHMWTGIVMQHDDSPHEYARMLTKEYGAFDSYRIYSTLYDEFLAALWDLVELGSSVSIVFDYGLDDWGSIPGRGKGFFLYPLSPDWLWGPPSLLFLGTRGPFHGGKSRPGRGAHHSPPSSAEVKNE